MPKKATGKTKKEEKKPKAEEKKKTASIKPVLKSAEKEKLPPAEKPRKKIVAVTKEPVPEERELKKQEDIAGDFSELEQNGEAKESLKPERYWEAVGRRKSAVARVRLYTRGEKGVWIGEKPYGVYFQTLELQKIVEDALKKMKADTRFRVSVKLSGGGTRGQAEAIRHGISRALVKFNADFRKRLKRAGYLTRDPRVKERRKFGLKKARKAPQWAKR
ncbi:30S ribosomal protein S9 [Patescibacteria group bacterium]|nr:30S ribosomal protein S9 [Patescibacteria group bacterium]